MHTIFQFVQQPHVTFNELVYKQKSEQLQMTKFANRYRREVTTMLPELPQSDMSPGALVPITDACYPFVNTSNHQFFSPGYNPGYPEGTYTNNTDCVVVIEGLWLFPFYKRQH
ncbi:unnamed protein product [Brassicogethes aeneus]|uniref:Uncharacterized protein n=1 Tax=Brassicogethes aeneus TaxID=1431903 RepID=A0A9P0AX58_BRAAE|nr:unnamed protein product [Brassicogethes aeneus]